MGSMASAETSCPAERFGESFFRSSDSAEAGMSMSEPLDIANELPGQTSE